MTLTPPQGERPAAASSGAGRPLSLGLLAAGLALGGSRAIARIAEGPATAAAVAGAILEAAAISLGSGLAGLAFDLAAGLAAARIERKEQSERAHLALAERAVTALEKIAETPGRQPTSGAATAPAPLDADRGRLLAEIDLALRPGRLGDAGALLNQFAVRYPDDPALTGRLERLDAARKEEMEGNLAEIQAARQVNDPARVLALYRSLDPSMELERRGALERELSRWFQEVIFRRLRSGRIQPDVVELATLVAETFARTVEGASLHASLPTLRRSVGLCPRCARPYAGTAAACSQCLATPGAGPGSAGSGPEPGEDDIETEPGPGGGPDADWVFYDEEGRDGPAPSA